MPKEYFSVDRISRIASLRPGARIHVVGAAGVAMGQIAIELRRRGFDVSGSDKDFYEPMGGELARGNVRTIRGYSGANITADIELALIGNVVSYGHPEVLEIERRGTPYTIFPAALAELVIGDRHSIVAAGTHGKSTTAGLIGSTMRSMGLDPAYFVGGVMRDFKESLYVGRGACSVVEGDEYDSAFFAKVPKFTFYKAKTLIITSVEYDHADIYSSLEAVNLEFTKIVESLPADGALIVCVDGQNISRLVKSWRAASRAPIISYGSSPESDYRIISRRPGGGEQKIIVQGPNAEQFEFSLGIPGEANAKNALAGILAAERAGVSRADFITALRDYHGVKRRQEIRYSGRGIVLIEDFAHHPTAVRETIAAIREFYPGRLWAVFEPRSNTSRKRIFQKDYVSAFTLADQTILCGVAKRAEDADADLLDVDELSADIQKTGAQSRCLPDPAAIERTLTAEVVQGDVVLLMSNGSFGGLPDSLSRALKEAESR